MRSRLCDARGRLQPLGPVVQIEGAYRAAKARGQLVTVGYRALGRNLSASPWDARLLLGEPPERIQQGRRRIDEPEGDFLGALVAPHELDADGKPPLLAQDIQKSGSGGADSGVRVAVRHQKAAERPVDRLMIGAEKCEPDPLRFVTLMSALLGKPRRSWHCGLQYRNILVRHGGSVFAGCRQAPAGIRANPGVINQSLMLQLAHKF